MSVDGPARWTARLICYKMYLFLILTFLVEIIYCFTYSDLAHSYYTKMKKIYEYMKAEVTGVETHIKNLNHKSNFEATCPTTNITHFQIAVSVLKLATTRPK